MQAQTTEHLREYRFNRGILIALAGIGLLIASLVGIRALTDGQSVSRTPTLSPVAVSVQEDPLLAEGWVDSYFEQPVVIPAAQDPPLPNGWVDLYVERDAISRSGITAGGVNSTTLNLDQSGGDFVPATAIGSVPATDLTTLPLDRDGADSTLGFIADNAFDNAGLDRSAAIHAFRILTDGDLGYVVASTEEIHFHEMNVWAYEPIVQVAGTADDQSVTVPDHRFLEENAWERSTQTPNSQVGLTEH